MYKQPLRLSRADMISSGSPLVDEDTIVDRIERLTHKNSIVNNALLQTDLRFSLVKYEKSLRRVAGAFQHQAF
jgi:hypothetical protein